MCTTTGWIAAHPQGMLGPIWRTAWSGERREWQSWRPRGRLESAGRGEWQSWRPRRHLESRGSAEVSSRMRAANGDN
jgi:hypothetical protein